MAKKYDDSLVRKIKEKQTVEQMYGIDVLVKPIPDCNIDGAMDPRLYASSKKMAWIMKLMPKSMMKMDVSSPKALARLRRMFNNVDSTPMVDEPITIEQLYVQANDGYKIPLKVYSKTNGSDGIKPVLYYIHGGGFFGGHTGVVEEAMKLIVANEDIIVFSVDYRLAPENPYPTGHQDCFSALEWINKHAQEYNGNGDVIFVAGDSAGGNLTQYVTNRSLEENMTCVKGQILLYPTVNMGEVKDELARFDISKVNIYSKHEKVLLPMLTMMTDSGDMLGSVLGTDDIMNPYLTPYMKIRDDLPPTMVSVGEHDFLVVESLAYANKLVKAGVDVTTILYKGMGHAYIDHVGNYPQSEDLIDEMGAFVKKYAQ